MATKHHFKFRKIFFFKTNEEQSRYLEQLLLLNFFQIYSFLAPKWCIYSHQGAPSVNKVPLRVKFLGQKLA
jgi:hypothetical protein